MSALLALGFLLVPQESVEKLVERLASASIEEREAAALELALRGDAAVPALERASRAADAETAARAKSILAAIPLLRGVTENLERSMPGARARLASGRVHEFTRVFLQASEQGGTTRRHPAVRREDLNGIARAALRGAESSEERIRVLKVVAAWRLEAALPEFAALLDDPDARLQAPLLEAIQWCRARELAPALLRRLRSERPESKGTWAGLLASLGCREAIPDITALLLAPAGHPMRSVAGSLASLDAVEAVPALLRALREGWAPHEVLPALRLLAPDEILPALASALSDEREQVRQAALDALTLYHPSRAALPLLRKRLEGASPAIRAQVLARLGHLRFEEALPDLRTALQDPDVAVRRAAAQALASFGSREGLPELLQALRHPESRIPSAYALQRLRASEAIPDLVALLKESKDHDRLAEIVAGFAVPEARPTIVTLLDSPDDHVRATAGWSLAVLDGAKALPTLRKLMEDPDRNVSWRAFSHLQLLDPRETLEDIRSWTRRSDPTDRSQALDALVRIRPEEAIPLFLKELDGPEHWLRASAIQRLPRLNVAEAVPRFRVLLTDPAPDVRRQAAVSLAWMGERDGHDLLFQVFRDGQEYAALNGIRRPEVVRAWRSKVLSGPPLFGSARALMGGLAQRAGIALDWPDAVPEMHVSFERELKVEGRDLFSLIDEIRWTCPTPVFEPGAIRFLPPREAKRFWLGWWASECLASGREGDRAEARSLLAELEASERRLEEFKRRALAAPAPEDLQRILTPALKAVPGLEARLASGKDEAWTRAFIEATGHPQLGNADFEVLVARALRGAMTPAEIERVLQVAAARQLAGARPGIEPHLAHASGGVRVAAALAILTLDGAAALPKVLPLLDDADGTVKTEVIKAFGRLELREANREILARQGDPAIQAGIVSAAGELELEEAIPLLLETADKAFESRFSDAYSTRISAGFQLRVLGGPALNGEFRKILRSEDHPNAIQTLVGGLSAWGGREAVPDLVDLIEKPRQLKMMYLPSVFGALAPLGAREAASTILAHLKPDRFLPEAASAAAELGLADAVPLLRALVQAEVKHGLPQAVVALGSLGDRSSLERLRGLLEHSEGGVRAAAVHALALLRDAPSYDRMLAVAREAENYSTDLRSALALIPRDEAPKLLCRGITYADSRAFSAIGRGGPGLLDTLRPLLGSPDVWTRQTAVHAIGRIDGPEALAEIRRRLQDGSPDVRQAAAQVLCRRGLREGVPLSLECARQRYRALPFQVNAVRRPAAWARLQAAAIKGPFYGTARDLVARVAAEAKVRFEDLPADSEEAPAFIHVYVRIHEAEPPVAGVDALERLSQHRWMVVLEDDRVRILPRREAQRFWTDWWEADRR